MSGPVRALAAVALALVALWAATGPALAHTALIAASPTDGELMPAMPATVVLTLTEPGVALGTEVIVSGPTGQVQAGEPALSGRTVTQAVRTDVPPGDYTVYWRVTAADGHPAVGRFTFTVTEGSDRPGSGQPAGTGPAGPAPGAAAGAPPGWALLVVAVLILGAVALSARLGYRRSVPED